MALPDQYFRVRFNQGLDTEADPKTVVAGRLTRLENGTFASPDTIQKRPGHDPIENYDPVLQGHVTASSDVWSDGDTLYAWDGATVRAHVEGVGLLPVGKLRSPTVETRDLLPGARERWDGDRATVDDVSVVAWQEPDGVWVAVVDSRDDRPIRGPLLKQAGGTMPRVVVAGTQLLVTCVLANVIRVLRVNPGDLNASLDGAFADLVTDLDAPTAAAPYRTYDVASYDGAAVLAWPTAASRVKVGFISPYGAIASSGSGFSRPNVTTASLEQCWSGPALAVSDEGHLAVYSYSTGSGLQVRTMSAETLTWPPAQAIVNVDFSVPGDGYHVLRMGAAWSRHALADTRVSTCYWELSSSGLGLPVELKRTNTQPNGSTEQASTGYHVMWAHRLAGKPLALDLGTAADPAVVAPVTNVSDLQPTVFVVGQEGRPYARALSRLASPPQSGSLSGWSTTADGADALVLGRRRVVPLGVDGGGSVTGSAFADRQLSLLTTDWAATASVDWAARGGYVLVGGGQLHLVDGGSVTELGFSLDVDAFTATPVSASDGSTMTAGTHVIDPTYSWTDALGRRHTSHGLAPATVTLTGSQNSVVLRVPTLQPTWKGSGSACNPVTLDVWMTTAGGTQLRRADSPSSPVVLDRSGSHHVVHVGTSDAVLRTRELDYRNTDVVNRCPPAPRHVALAKGRLMLGGLEGQPDVVWFSKDLTDSAPAFSDARAFDVPPEGGTVAGLAQLDDSVVVFKRDRIMLTAGEPPTDLAQDPGGFPTPVQINSDVGCADSRTVVEVAGDAVSGLVFRSAKGFRLLDRGRSVRNVGAPVHDLQGHRYGRGLREPDSEVVRWHAPDGVGLALDARFGQWGAYTGPRAVGAAVWDGRYAMADAHGRVYVRSTGSYRDGSVATSMVIETGWLAPGAGLQDELSFRRFEVLGEYRSPHRLRVDVAYDYRDSYVETHTRDTRTTLTTGSGYGEGGYGAGAYGGGRAADYRFEFEFRRRRASAVRLRFTFIPTTDDGAAASLTELSLTVGVDQGQRRLPGARRR